MRWWKRGSMYVPWGLRVTHPHHISRRRLHRKQRFLVAPGQQVPRRRAAREVVPQYSKQHGACHGDGMGVQFHRRLHVPDAARLLRGWLCHCKWGGWQGEGLSADAGIGTNLSQARLPDHHSRMSKAMNILRERCASVWNGLMRLRLISDRTIFSTGFFVGAWLRMVRSQAPEALREGRGARDARDGSSVAMAALHHESAITRFACSLTLISRQRAAPRDRRYPAPAA